MSADAWDFCPVCNTEIKNLEKKIKEGYGKLDYSEFKILSTELENKKRQFDPTLREDYEIYIKDNILKIDFRAKCTKCNFNFSYKKEIDIITGEEK